MTTVTGSWCPPAGLAELHKVHGGDVDSERADAVTREFWDADFVAMPNHQLLKSRPHDQLENRHNLEMIASDRFTFVGMPLHPRGATAPPSRAVAVVK
jgi:kynurenine formamidase